MQGIEKLIAGRFRLKYERGICMKKVFSLMLTLVLVCLSITVCAQDATVPEAVEPFSFRDGVTWGMTAEEIIKCEGKKPDQQAASFYVYSDVLSAAKKSTVIYTVDSENGLSNIMIMFNEEHSNDNLYIDDFDDIDESLDAKYGAPNSADRKLLWSNSLYKDSGEEYWGIAISSGDLQILSHWMLDGYQILHLVSGDNYVVSHYLMYMVDEFETNVVTDGI